MHWLWVGILAGKVLGERQCILKREAQYVNVLDSIHWEVVYNVKKCTPEGKYYFKLIIEIDQSEATKSHMHNTS